MIVAVEETVGLFLEKKAVGLGDPSNNSFESFFLKCYQTLNSCLTSHQNNLICSDLSSSASHKSTDHLYKLRGVGTHIVIKLIFCKGTSVQLKYSK